MENRLLQWTSRRKRYFPKRLLWFDMWLNRVKCSSKLTRWDEKPCFTTTTFHINQYLFQLKAVVLQWLTHAWSNHRRCSVRKGVLRNFVKFTGNYLCSLIKKKLWRKCVPVNFAKFLRTPFLQNTSRRQLLSCSYFNSFFWRLPFPDTLEKKNLQEYFQIF